MGSQGAGTVNFNIGSGTGNIEGFGIGIVVFIGLSNGIAVIRNKFQCVRTGSKFAEIIVIDYSNMIFIQAVSACPHLQQYIIKIKGNLIAAVYCIPHVGNDPVNIDIISHSDFRTVIVCTCDNGYIQRPAIYTVGIGSRKIVIRFLADHQRKVAAGIYQSIFQITIDQSISDRQSGIVGTAGVPDSDAPGKTGSPGSKFICSESLIGGNSNSIGRCPLDQSKIVNEISVACCSVGNRKIDHGTGIGRDGGSGCNLHGSLMSGAGGNIHISSGADSSTACRAAGR